MNSKNRRSQKTVSIDTSDNKPHTLEFKLPAEKQTTELTIHQKSAIKGMKMEAEIELKTPTFSETVAIDTSDHKTQTVEFQLQSEKKATSEISIHQTARPKGMKMEAEILVPLKETSHMIINKSKCIAGVSSQREEYKMNLEGAPPKFLWELLPQKVMDGGKVAFSSKVWGNPMPETVNWSRNGRPCSNSFDLVTSYDKETGDVVLFIAEIFPEDAGLYECVASNVYGTATTSALLTVEGEFILADFHCLYLHTLESFHSRMLSVNIFTYPCFACLPG